MATSGGIRAGRAFVELYADSTKLQADLRNIEAKFKAVGVMVANWGKAMAVAGTAVLAPLLALTKQAASLGDRLTGMSQRTGIGVEMLSALDYAASQANTSLEEFEVAIKSMQKSLAGVGEDSAGAAEAFRRLGIDVATLRTLSPEDQFKTIADALSKVHDPAQKAALALKIFGKSGTELIPLLNGGSKGLNEYIKRVKELGLVYSSQELQEASTFNNKLAEMWAVMRRLGFTIGITLIPPLTDLANKIETMIVGVTSWIRANKEWVIWTALTATAIVAAGVALFVFGKAIVYSMAVLNGVQAALAAVWAIFSAIGGGIATVVTSPWLALIAVVVAVGAAYIWLSGVGGKAVDWLAGRFAALRDFATEVFHGIADALLAGDIALAAKILWQTLKIIWQTGVNTLDQVWLKIKLNTMTVIYDTITAVKAAWEELMSFLASGWINVIAGLQVAWTEFSRWYQLAVEGLANLIAVHLYGADPAYVDEQTGHNVGQINSTADAQRSQIETQRKASLDENKKTNEDNLSRIGQEFADQLAKMQQSGASQTDADQQKLNELNEELANLLKQARQERNISDGKMISAGVPPDFSPGMNMAKASFGTFNAFGAAAAGSVGGASVLETAAKETAKNTSEIVQGVDDLRKTIENNGAVFT